MFKDQSVTTAAIIAFVTIFLTFGKSIKDFLVSSVNFIFGTINIDKHVSSAVYCYCRDHMQLVSLRSRTYMGCNAIVEKTGIDTSVIFEMLTYSITIFRVGLKFIIIIPGQYYYDESCNSYEIGLKVWLPRIMWKPEQFIINASAYYDKLRRSKKDRRFFIHRISGKSESKIEIIADNSQRSQRAQKSSSLLQEARCGRASPIGTKLKDIIGRNSCRFQSFSISR